MRATVRLHLLPLMLDAAGIPRPHRTLDGRNPTDALAGRAPSPHHRLIFTYGRWAAIRKGSLKLVRSGRGKPDELYDLSADPGEKNDLSATRPRALESLKADLDGWLAQFPR